MDLVDLVRNRTLSADAAATLWTAADERRSFVVVAIPRLAGKSTLMQAILARAPRGTAIRTFGGSKREADALLADADRGYLIVPEISRAPVPSYLWGEPVRRAFRLLRAGFSLATALHAPGVEETFAIICGGNAVPDEDASRIALVAYVRSLGDWESPTRRVVASIHEIDGVVRGRARARLLHRWNEAADRFETVEVPRGFGQEARLRERAAQLA